MLPTFQPCVRLAERRAKRGDTDEAEVEPCVAVMRHLTNRLRSGPQVAPLRGGVQQLKELRPIWALCGSA